MNIKDKVIIVTGASQGIGEAAALEIAKRGAKIVLAARSLDKLEVLSSAIPGSLVVKTDVCKAEDIKNLFQKTIEHFGRIDVVINNAGMGLMSAIESVKMEDYRAIMDLNVFSILDSMQQVIPIMRAQGGGMILNISSMVSKNYYPRLGAYASTKYALNALSLTARTELEKDNIIVSVFHPKMTTTNFGKNALGTSYVSGANMPASMIDSAETVAIKIADQIESGVAEVMM